MQLDIDKEAKNMTYEFDDVSKSQLSSYSIEDRKKILTELSKKLEILRSTLGCLDDELHEIKKEMVTYCLNCNFIDPLWLSFSCIAVK